MSDEKDAVAAKKLVRVDLKKPWTTPSSATDIPGAGKTKPASKTSANKTATKNLAIKRSPIKQSPAKQNAPVKKVQANPAAALPGKARTLKADTDSARAKRTFPQRPLEDCFRLAHALREHNGGNAWSPQHLAESINQSASSSGFFYLTAASRDYGLTIGTRDASKIELSPLGRELVYPKSPSDESKALITAFRNIELFAKVYDYYTGGNLPEVQYLKNTLKTEWGVDEAYQDDFYELFQKNLAYLKSKGDLPAAGTGAQNSTRSGGTSILLGESAKAGNLVAFIAMPFSEKTSAYKQGYFDEVLKHLITPAAVKANFNSRTAKKAGSEVIQSTIVNDLYSADLVIVDLTEHNPNVLFELGMRIAFNKAVCLIRAKGTGAIFDIDHMLRVYDYNPSMWPSTLEVDIPGLSDHIVKTWEGRNENRSYLTMLRDNKPE